MMGRNRLAALMLVSLMSITIIACVGESDAVVLEDETGNIMYSSSDVPVLQNREFIVPVEVKSGDGDVIYYRYDVTDFDPSNHTVTLEVYYTDEWWGGGPYPPFENRRDFHSGASHAGDIKIENDEYGWYSFVWMNEGSKKCTFDYTIGAKDSSSLEVCSSSMIGIVLLALIGLVVVLGRR